MGGIALLVIARLGVLRPQSRRAELSSHNGKILDGESLRVGPRMGDAGLVL
jgi:hypothetical protein